MVADLPGTSAALWHLPEWRHAAGPDMPVAKMEHRQAYGLSF
jgi:hypothetical protein